MNEKDPILEMLDALKETPERDPAQAAKGRERFLAQAKNYSKVHASVSLLSRLKAIFSQRQPLFQLSSFTLAIVIGLLLLGFSSSVVAAQRAQPNQLLYPYKLWLEDQRLALTTKPESRIKLHLHYAEYRLNELLAASAVPGDSVYDRTTSNFNHQIDAARALLTESHLDGNLKEKLNNLNQEYQDLFDDGPDHPDDVFGPLEEGGINTEDNEISGSTGKFEKEMDDSKDREFAPDGTDEKDNKENSNDSDGSNDDQPDYTEEPDHEDGSDGLDKTEEPDGPIVTLIPDD